MFIEGRHIVNLLRVKWSNFCNFAYNFKQILPRTKFYEKRLIIDGVINEKHALQIIWS